MHQERAQDKATNEIFNSTDHKKNQIKKATQKNIFPNIAKSAKKRKCINNYIIKWTRKTTLKLRNGSE
jgi:hypothetical protein